MILIGVTLLILASWYAFLTAHDGGPLSMLAVLAATGCSGQIALTCTLLGATGLLTREIVLALNLVIAAALLAAAAVTRTLQSPRTEPTRTPETSRTEPEVSP